MVNETIFSTFGVQFLQPAYQRNRFMVTIDGLRNVKMVSDDVDMITISICRLACGGVVNFRDIHCHLYSMSSR